MRPNAWGRIKRLACINASLKFLNDETNKTNALPMKIYSDVNSVAKDIIENIQETDFVQEDDEYQKVDKTNAESVKIDFEDILENISKEKDFVQEENDHQKHLNVITNETSTEPEKMDSEENSLAIKAIAWVLEGILEGIPKEKDFVQEDNDHQTFLNDSNDKSKETNAESVKKDSEENSTCKDIIENIPKEKDFVQNENDHQKHLNDIDNETTKTTANQEKMDFEENSLAIKEVMPNEKDFIQVVDDHKVVYQLLDNIMEIVKNDGPNENLENSIREKIQQIKDEISKLSKISTTSVPTTALVSLPPPPPPGPPPPPPPTRDPLSSLRRSKITQGGITGSDHVEVKVQKAPEADMMNQLAKMLNRRKNRASLGLKYSNMK